MVVQGGASGTPSCVRAQPVVLRLSAARRAVPLGLTAMAGLKWPLIWFSGAPAGVALPLASGVSPRFRSASVTCIGWVPLLVKVSVLAVRLPMVWLAETL